MQIMALNYHMWRYAETTSSGLSAGILQTPVARVHMCYQQSYIDSYFRTITAKMSARKTI